MSNFVMNIVGYGLLSAAAGLLAWQVYEIKVERPNLGRELCPFVSAVDNKPGISVQDRIDFAKRAELPKWMIREMPEWGSEWDFDIYPSESLKKALDSYKNQSTSHD